MRTPSTTPLDEIDFLSISSFSIASVAARIYSELSTSLRSFISSLTGTTLLLYTKALASTYQSSRSAPQSRIFSAVFRSPGYRRKQATRSLLCNPNLQHLLSHYATRPCVDRIIVGWNMMAQKVGSKVGSKWVQFGNTN